MRSSLIGLSIALCTLVLSNSACKKENDDLHQKIEEPTDTLPDNPVDTTPIATKLPCNGDTALCGKKYDEMVYVMTHNSHAHLPVFSPLAANQNQTVTQQLQDGVRALNFKTYYTDNSACGTLDVYVYHGFEALGCITFRSVLVEVKQFLLDNPREVVTLHIEGSASVARMNDVFTSLALDTFFHQQILGQPWPTLEELIESGNRIVLFTDRGSDNATVAGFHDSWSFMVDHDYDAQQLSDFDCAWYRGNPNGGLYLFNHFITRLTPQPDSARVINTYDKLMGRINECQSFHGRRPTFLHVDFYDYGDAIRVADELNGL